LGGMATGAGLVGAAAGARVLESLLFGVSAADPFTYAAVAVVLLGTVTLATLMPAMRAAKIDPLVALRR
jgi:putative ABC transport system permease protein